MMHNTRAAGRFQQIRQSTVGIFCAATVALGALTLGSRLAHADDAPDASAANSNAAASSPNTPAPTDAPASSDAPAAADAANATPSSGDAPPADSANLLHPSSLLGQRFSSASYGIAFRPPQKSTEIHKSVPDTIVEFDREDFNWQLKVWRVRLERGLPLSTHKNLMGQDEDGIVERTIANIRQQLPEAQVLRNEIINVGKARVALIAVRYENASHDRKFTQQAIVEAPNANYQLYYFFDLTGPGKPKTETEDVTNPAEKQAYDTFSQVVDSIELLDRTNIAQDQQDRLFRSRYLFVQWDGENNSIIRNAAQGEHYQRIVRNGRDIGYQYIIEEVDDKDRLAGSALLRVGVKARMMASPSVRWDTETWMTSTLDRKHEHWTVQGVCNDGHGKILENFSQLGASDELTHAASVQQQQAKNGSLLPDNSPGNNSQINIVTARSLEVSASHGKAQLAPFKQDVPAFYVPQAVSYILPSLLPLKPRTYMVATYVAAPPGSLRGFTGGQVMARYLDVLPLKSVHFNGQTFDAIPITDKLGLDGVVTTNYFSADGQFMGSTSSYDDGDSVSKVDIIPTDAQTISRLWPSSDLTPPAPMDAAGASSGSGDSSTK